MTEVLSEITEPPRNEKAEDQATVLIESCIEEMEAGGFASHVIGDALARALHQHIVNQYAKDDSHKLWAYNFVRGLEEDCQWHRAEIEKDGTTGVKATG